MQWKQMAMMNSAIKIACNQVITPKLAVDSFQKKFQSIQSFLSLEFLWSFISMIEKSDTSRYEILYLQICCLWEVI